MVSFWFTAFEGLDLLVGSQLLLFGSGTLLLPTPLQKQIATYEGMIKN